MTFGIQFLIGGIFLLAVSVCHIHGQGVQANNTPRCTAPWIHKYDQFSGKSICFWYSVDKASWIEAAAWCKTIGGHLVELDPARKGNVIVRNIPQQYKGKFWIGLSDIEENGTYRWMYSRTILSSPPLVFTTLPDRTKNCVNIDEKGQWIAEVCNTQLQFVCEKRMSMALSKRMK